MSAGNRDGTCTDCGSPVWWDGDQLVDRAGGRWCYGPSSSRWPDQKRWHALPGMPQYVVPARDGQVCHCLARGYPHIHKIVAASAEDTGDVEAMTL